MNDIAKANLHYAFQTDTMEGWIYKQNNHSWNVTVTSTHSVILGRHVPVLMRSVTKSIIFTNCSIVLIMHHSINLRGNIQVM